MMDGERRHELLDEYLRPLLFLCLSFSICVWEFGFSTLGRRAMGAGLMTYALLSIHESALQYDLFECNR